MSTRISALMLLMVIWCNTAFAQNDKWLGEGGGKEQAYANNVKVNVSSWLLYNKAFVLSYERTINAHQTAAVTGGYMELPQLLNVNLKDIDIRKNVSQSGYMFGGEYRFYLARENKYAPPHGLYIGPYVTYYHFDNKRNLSVRDSAGNPLDLTLKTSISNFNIGFELGYQFILAKRISLDFILIGPSIANYTAKFKLDGNIDPESAQFYNQELAEALINRFPLLNKLFENKEVDVQGNGNVWAPGFRYAIFVGYTFGRR